MPGALHAATAVCFMGEPRVRLAIETGRGATGVEVFWQTADEAKRLARMILAAAIEVEQLERERKQPELPFMLHPKP